MALPDASVTIRDGALGLASNASPSAQIKFGISTLGYLNTLYAPSDPTTLTGSAMLGKGGPLTEAAALSLSVAGGPVYCVPVTPSTYGTASAVTKLGTGAETLAVAVKPAVSIMAKCTTAGTIGNAYYAFSVDGGVTWSTPVVSAATVMVPNCPQTTVAFAAGTAVLGDTQTVSTAGTITGSGGQAMTLSTASPVDAYNAVVTITTGGALGTMAFTYSLDGGITVKGPILSTGGGTYVIPDTGLLLTFTGSSTAGDVLTFTTTSASYTTSDLTNAWNAIITDPRTWGLAHVVGAPAAVAAAATLLTTVDGLLSTAASNYRYARAVVEVPTDTDANTIAAFAAAASTRVGAAASQAYTVSAINGWVLPRSSAWHFMARVASTSLSRDPGAVRDGALRYIPGSISGTNIAASAKPLVRDEQVTQGLDAARFITLRSILGVQGFYVTNGNLMAATGSDFKWIQYGRVMDAAATALRTAALLFLNDTVFTNADGTIQEKSARNIESVCDNAVRGALGTGNISDLQVLVNRTNNVTSTATVYITLRVQPVGYAKIISLDVGFRNPALGA